MSTLEDLLIKVGIDTGRASRDAGKLRRTLDKTWAGVKRGAAVGGAAAGAALMTGLQELVEQSKPLAVLEAQLGAGTPLAAAAGEAAGLVYGRGLVGSMEEATDAVRATMQARLVPADAVAGDIDRIAAKVTQLAASSRSDAEKVSNAVSNMLRNGLAATAEEAFDTLQAGIERGVDKSGDLLDTFNEYSVQFRKLGIDGPTAMGLLSQAVQAGARDSDTAADALKELSIRAVDGGAQAAAGFQLAGLNAQEMTGRFAEGGASAASAFAETLEAVKAIRDPVDKNAAAVALFGTKAEDLGDALFAMDVGRAASELGDLAGASDRAGQALEQNAGARLEAFRRAVQSSLIEQLGRALPVLEAAFGWFERNSEWAGPAIAALGALAVAIGVVTAATWAWGVAIAVTPIGWIAIAIGVFVAVIVWAATKTRFFQNIWEDVWGFMKSVGAWFAGPFVNFFKDAWGWIAGKFDQGKARVESAISSIKNTVTGLRDSFRRAVLDIGLKIASFVQRVRAMPGRVKSSLSNMWSGIGPGFRSAINYVIGKWNSLRFTIPSFSVLGKSFGGGSIGVPSIPFLASGGIVPATPGGRLVVAGEGGEAEAVVPLSKLPTLAGRDDRPIRVEVTGNETAFRRFLQQSIRVGGDYRPAGGAL